MILYVVLAPSKRTEGSLIVAKRNNGKRPLFKDRDSAALLARKTDGVLWRVDFTNSKLTREEA